MSSFIWSLLLTRTRPVFRSTTSTTALANRLQRTSFLFQQPLRLLSVKRLEEKKVERLNTLRSTVSSYYRSNNGNIHWPSLRRELEARGMYYRSNFEFALLSAFSESPDSVATEEGEQFEMDAQLFQLIANFVQKSPAVTSNKIAAIRFCRFLSTAPEFLNKSQTDFIRAVAEKILEDNIQVHQIILDVITALAHSSAENCLHTLNIYEPFIVQDFKLKLDVLQIVLSALVRYELSEELYQFMSRHYEFLWFDFDLTGQIIRHVAKKRTYENEPAKILDVIRFLSTSFAPIESKYRNSLVERILTRKLGYTSIAPTTISSHGVCSCCGTRLQGLTTEEFETLKSHFRTIIFDKNDAYLIANLSEFEVQLYEFEDRIKGASPLGPSHPKYDLVIDGLNVSYRQTSSLVHDQTGLRTYSRVYKIKDLDQQIVKVLVNNRIVDRFDQTLLIGREHMKNWYGLNRLLRQKQNRIDHCYLLNKTRDDNYILYAAIQHPATKIMSGDYFRDHREKFKEWYLRVEPKTSPKSATPETVRPNLPRLFSRWLRSHQIRLDENHRLKNPNEFDMKLHVHEDKEKNDYPPAMHIPIITKKDPHQNDDHEYEWICARHS